MAIREMDWDKYIGCPIRVYRNLNNGRMSLQAKEGKSWKVVGHVENCVLSSVKFKVQESGRQRVLRDRRKNVHAWGEGILLGEFDRSIATPIDLSYDPYHDETFKQRGTENPITACEYLAVRCNRVYVSADAVSQSTPIADRIIQMFTTSYHQFAA